MVSDIGRFQVQLKGLLEGGKDTAVLDPLEQELRISIERRDSLGHFLVKIEITPDPITQNHRFEFEIDQTYIRDMIAECETITKKIPIRE